VTFFSPSLRSTLKTLSLSSHSFATPSQLSPAKSPPRPYQRHPYRPPYRSPTQPPAMYRIPARRHSYQERHDGFASQLTPGGVEIQSPPQRSPQSPKFVSLCGFCDSLGHTIDNCAIAEQYLRSSQAIQSLPVPYTSSHLRDCSDAHLDKIATIQAQIDTLEQAKILARKRRHPGSIQPPVSPHPKSPYRFAPTPPPVSDTMEYSHPRGPMQPIYPGDPDHPENPDCHDDITTEDYEPEMIPLDFSRYELPEESDEPYQRPRGPMQPIPTGPDSESRIPGNVSDQLATPSEIFTQLRDDEKATAIIAPVEEVDEFFNDFSDDIFEYELESTQSSHATSSFVVTTRSMTWYREEPESRNTSPTPQSVALPSPTLSPVSPSSSLISSSSPVHHLNTLLLCPDILLDKLLSPAPNPPTSLPLPDVLPSHPYPSLFQPSGRSLSHTSWPQSFLQSFVTSASLRLKIPGPPSHSRLQPSESADSEKNSDTFELGIDVEDLTDIVNCGNQVANCSDRVANRSEPNETKTFSPEAAEPVECLSVLAEILADYEESNDTPVALRPNRSPFPPPIALEDETFRPLHATGKEPRSSEQSSPREYELLSLSLSSPEYLTPMNLWDPSPSLSTSKHSPLVATLLPYTPPALLSTPLASPVKAASLDIEPLRRYPVAVTTPESSSETPAGVCIAGRLFEEEEQPPDESLDKPSTTVPGISLVKYNAPAHDSFPSGSLALTTRCDRDSTVLTNQCPGLSLASSGPYTACPPAIDVAIRALPDPRLISLFNDETSAPLPLTLLPSSRLCRLASGIIGTSLSAATPQFLPDLSPDVPSPPVMTPVYPSPPEVFARSVLLDPATSTLLKSHETIPTVQDPALESHHESCPVALRSRTILPKYSHFPFDNLFWLFLLTWSFSRLLWCTAIASLYLGPFPMPSGLRASCRPAIGAASRVLLASQLFALFDETLPLLPATLPPSSQSRRLASRIVEIFALSIATRQTLPESWSPSPDSLVAVVRPYQLSRIRGWSDSAESSGACPPVPSSTPPPSSRLYQLALGTIEILSMTVRQVLPGPRSPAPESLISVVGPHRFPRICDRPDSESSGTRPPHRNDTDVLEYSDVALFPIALYHSSYVVPSSVLNLCLSSCFAVVPVRPVSFPQISFARSYRLPRFHRLAISDISLFVVRFFPLLSDGLFHLVVSRLLMSRAIFVAALFVSLTSHVTRLVPYVTSRRSLESRVYFFPSSCSCFTFLDFPEIFFPLVVFVILLFPPHFPNRGRSVFKAPGRGNRSLCSTSQVPGPTTHLSSPSHKAADSTPHITPHSLAIGPGLSRQSEPSIATKGRANDTGLALVVAQPRLTERFHHTQVGPEFSDHFAGVSRRFPDKVALLRDHSSHTEHPLPCMMKNSLKYTKTSLLEDQLSDGRDRPQCLDHGPILPSLGRSRIFYFATTSSLRTGSSARDLRLKGSDDDSTSGEGFPMSRYDLKNIRALFEITSSWNQEGVHQPGMVGI